MKHLTLFVLAICTALLLPVFAWAQSDDATANDLLQPEELETLVGPVALYPDTLLIQILVAATYPLDVVKADRMVTTNADTAAEDLKPMIDAEGWDESVAVLATAFPDVLNDMAVNIDWTETLGNAMLVQSEDLLDAVQTQRQRATESGALTSGDEQTVEVTQEDGDQTIIIQPTDPDVVYVPQYQPETVYVTDPNSGTNDALATGLMAFATVAVISEIFDDNDPWSGYWGCRNCGGWNGRPVVGNPRVDIDVDGNVNIGDRNNVGWKPDERRQQQARNDIARKRGNDGARAMPVNKPDRGDQMRSDLSRKSGAADISGRKNPKAGVERPAGLSAGDRKAITDRTGTPRNTGASAKPKQRANAPKARAAAPPKRKAAPSSGAMHKRAPSARTNAGASRGRSAAAGRKRR